MSSLEEALNDRDKQINQLREQRDRAEKDTKEEKELHERELAEYKMKIHTYDSEVILKRQCGVSSNTFFIEG